MATFTENLVVEVSANTQQLSQGLNGAAQDVNSFSGSVDQSAESVRDAVQANDEFNRALAQQGLDVRSASDAVLNLNPHLATMATETAEVAGRALEGSQNVAEFGKQLVLGATQSRGLRGALSRLTRSFAGSLGLGAAIGAVISLGPAIISFFRDTGEAAEEAARQYESVFESLVSITSGAADIEVTLSQARQELDAALAEERTLLQLRGRPGFGEDLQQQLEEVRQDIPLLQEMIQAEEARLRIAERFSGVVTEDGGGGGIVNAQRQIADDSERAARAWNMIQGSIEALPTGPPGIRGDLGAAAQDVTAGVGPLTIDPDFLDQLALIRDIFPQIESLAGGIGDAIGGWVTGANNFGEAIAQAFARFVQGLISAIAQALILGAIINAIPGLREFLELTGLVTGGGLSGSGGGAAPISAAAGPPAPVRAGLQGGNVFAGQLTVDVPQVARAQQAGLRFNQRSGMSGF